MRRCEGVIIEGQKESFAGDHSVVMASWVCTYFNIYQTEHFKYTEPIVHSLYLNRAVEKQGLLLRQCSNELKD